MMKRKTIQRKRSGGSPRKTPRAHYPRGWDHRRAEAIAAHYDLQSDEEAIAELEAAFEDEESALIQVPLELVPAVRKLLAKKAG